VLVVGRVGHDDDNLLRPAGHEVVAWWWLSPPGHLCVLGVAHDVAPHAGRVAYALSALDAADRARLAGLLRRLLLDFEDEHIDCLLPFGLRLAPAHIARARRAAVGLTDRVGLLITEVLPDAAAAQAGLRAGDLVVDIAGRPVRDRATLTDALSDVGAAVRVEALHGEDSVVVDVPTGR
jgi:S1-C subfamily serine protease